MAIRKRLSGQRGFTLIELLVVVAILGILATVAVPRVMDAIDNARTKKALADMTVIRDGLERFYVDYGVFPPSLDYLKGKPAAGLNAITAYIDPNFTFENSYGNVYLYIVHWEGLLDASSLKDYKLGDPGRTPDETIPFVDAALAFPSGLGPVLSEAYFWGAEVSPVVVDALSNFIVTKNTDGSQFELLFELTGFQGAPDVWTEPVPTAVSFTYTGQ